MDIPASQSIAVKRRQRQRGADQYQRLGHASERLVVHEGRIKVLVNLQTTSIPACFWIIGRYVAGLLRRLGEGTFKPFQLHRRCHATCGSGWRENQYQC
ncbi:MAG: hypothetical protein CM15mP84_09270 [Cellvibrionales bacterium]|nr:MAG: hypothetical protein CM15mP84_09270 [Cellvibrionales bacterium]